MSDTKSLDPMLRIEGNILVSDIHVDAHGNLVIKNKHLAKQVEAYLASDHAKSMQRQEVHLLCCKLSCPACE